MLERWEVSSLRLAAGSSFPERLSAVAQYVRERAPIFARAAFVVVEHQMQSQMRVIAGALFAAIAMVAPGIPLVFQQSSAKLNWEDLSEVTGCEASLRGNAAYTARKKAGVSAVCYLLNTTLPARRRKPADGGRASLGAESTTMQFILRNGDKRDDLADSLLHLLAYDVRRRREPAARHGRKRRKSDDEGLEAREQATSPGNCAERA
jgi:hypothetical protein